MRRAEDDLAGARPNLWRESENLKADAAGLRLQAEELHSMAVETRIELEDAAARRASEAESSKRPTEVGGRLAGGLQTSAETRR